MHRAAKSGLAREAQEKVHSKYSPQLAGEVLQWVQQNTGESFNTDGKMENFCDVLEDGYILGILITKLGYTKISASLLSKRQTAPFKKMELVGKFIDGVRALGVDAHNSFQTVDLTDRTNPNQVVICLDALGRKMGTFGVKEAQQNKRQFSKEQLDAGKNVISLQYGSNQGATQAGQNFGCQRHIYEPEKKQ
ncbi:myophilin-like [Ylistrum balloti]|uniref:myophilin-like n=1 Tax=Ylistrum balloti TaxID=509963 RepID=UPI002905C040|nr:myophilin-like [Ylistrum balloti]